MTVPSPPTPATGRCDVGPAGGPEVALWATQERRTGAEGTWVPWTTMGGNPGFAAQQAASRAAHMSVVQMTVAHSMDMAAILGFLSDQAKSTLVDVAADVAPTIDPQATIEEQVAALREELGGRIDELTELIRPAVASPDELLRSAPVPPEYAPGTTPKTDDVAFAVVMVIAALGCIIQGRDDAMRGDVWGVVASFLTFIAAAGSALRRS